MNGLIAMLFNSQGRKLMYYIFVHYLCDLPDSVVPHGRQVQHLPRQHSTPYRRAVAQAPGLSIGQYMAIGIYIYPLHLLGGAALRGEGEV